ncbi:hypothetical protein BaRGS_00029468 [Batillaria attramentaria]|uniref:NADH dehydrogenase subunit 6 n=1 Tax=Batillaria attramentaria TaxID=370345 RepID=A0ABD0JWJ7_9CAEN
MTNHPRNENWWSLGSLLCTSSPSPCGLVNAGELIVLSVTAPPLSWPGSWYGYLSAAYYGMAGLVLLLLVPCTERMLPLRSDPNCLILMVSLLLVWCLDWASYQSSK